LPHGKPVIHDLQVHRKALLQITVREFVTRGHPLHRIFGFSNVDFLKEIQNLKGSQFLEVLKIIGNTTQQNAFTEGNAGGKNVDRQN